MTNYSKPHRIDAIIIFVLGMLAFILFLPPEFIAFQTRFALFAKEMHYFGPTLFPMTYMGPYPDYPATGTFLIYLITLITNHFNTIIGILPTAITSALILVFIYFTGALHSRRWGIFAVLLALLTQQFVDASRSISPDPYTSLFAIMAFYIVHSSDLLEKTKRLFWIPVILVLGFMFRGPIGLVIPAAIILVYYFYQRDCKKFFIYFVSSSVLFCLCLIALLLAAYHQGGSVFMHRVITMQMFSRLGEAHGGFHFGYYWWHGFGNYALTYPLAILVILVKAKDMFVAYKHPHDKTNRFLASLALWLAVVLIGMSLPGAKKIRYILPIAPACALLATYVFIDAQDKIINILRHLLQVILWFMPIVALVGSIAYFYLNILVLEYTIPLYRHFSFVFIIKSTFKSSLSSILLHPLTLIIITIIVFILFCALFFKYRTHRRFLSLLFAALSLLIINVGILENLNYQSEQTKPFVSTIYKIYQKHPKPIVFYQMGPDAEDIKVALNWPVHLQPKFIFNLKQLKQYKASAYFVSEQKPFWKFKKTLNVKPLAFGLAGHKHSVMFIKLSGTKG